MAADDSYYGLLVEYLDDYLIDEEKDFENFCSSLFPTATIEDARAAIEAGNNNRSAASNGKGPVRNDITNTDQHQQQQQKHQISGPSAVSLTSSSGTTKPGTGNTKKGGSHQRRVKPQYMLS
mmetsp:Transcript_27796/g.46695  ORF Transcript_27796/g.46695 Transcript_27796/m.46695 type:complete len:122 (-) Transcript_27796:1627-1992(-)